MLQTILSVAVVQLDIYSDKLLSFPPPWPLLNNLTVWKPEKKMEKERKYYTNEEKLSLVRRIFFDLLFSMQRDSKRICKRDRLRLLIKWRINKKKFFSFFTLTPSLFAWNALFIVVSVVRVSLAVIRPVSLRLQNEGQKNTHGYHSCTRSLWPRIFFDLFFSMQRDSKRICKRYRLRLQR